MTLYRLIPYSSALAMLAIGCNEASSPIGFGVDAASDSTSSDAGSDASSDAGADSAVLDDVSVIDAVVRPDGGPADAGSPDVAPDGGPDDAGRPDVVTRPDTGQGDAGSPTISDETREAVRVLCEQYEACGFGPARECAADVGDGLFEYAYETADDFEACDVALSKFLTCVGEELAQECSPEAQYNCELEQRDIIYDCGLFGDY